MSAPRKRKTKRQAAAANAAAVLFCPRSRAQPIAAGGPVPVSQIAATIAADGGGRTRSRGPNRRDDHSRWRQRPSLLPSACLFNSFSRKERCGGGRSPFPFPLLSPAAACGKNAASAGGASRPLPSVCLFRQPLAERTPRRRAALASPPRRTRARPGRKRTFPFTTLPAKMKKNAPPGRKRTLSQGIPLEQ